MKIFIGTSDIASQIGNMAKGFHALGHETLTAAAKVAVFQESPLDYTFNEMAYRYFKWIPVPSIRNKYYRKFGPPRERILQKALKSCDVFVFVSFSFRRDLSDLKVIKEAGKKIVFIFTGTDVRWLNAMQQDFALNDITPVPYDTYDDSLESLKKRLGLMRKAEQYADVILSLPNQSQLALRPYFPYRQFINPEEFDHRPQQRKRPVVIHAASNSSVKGSAYVKEAFENLKAKGVDFEYRLLSGMPRSEIKKEYADCDILVGQLFIPSAGFQERELLACGKVVMSSLILKYPDHQLQDSPIIDVNPKTLESELERIIPDYDRRQKLADAALPFLLKHHSPEVFCQNMLDALDGNLESEKIVPNFFRDKYLPEEEFVQVYNEMTSDVKLCPWYREIVQGTRNGLEF